MAHSVLWALLNPDLKLNCSLQPPHLGQVSVNTALLIHSLCDITAGAISNCFFLDLHCVIHKKNVPPHCADNLR